MAILLWFYWEKCDTWKKHRNKPAIFSHSDFLIFQHWTIKTPHNSHFPFFLVLTWKKKRHKQDTITRLCNSLQLRGASCGFGCATRTWSALLEELVEVQRGGSGVGLLGSRRRRGGLLRFLHRVFERRAGVGPAGEVTQVEKQKRRIRLTSNVRVNTCGVLVFFFFYLGLVFVLICVSRSWGGSVGKDMSDEHHTCLSRCKWEAATSPWNHKLWWLNQRDASFQSQCGRLLLLFHFFFTKPHSDAPRHRSALTQHSRFQSLDWLWC